MFIADRDPYNLKQLIDLLSKNYGIIPHIMNSERSFREFIRNPEGGAVFVRIDHPSIEGLRLSAETTAFNPAVQLVWMAASAYYAVDAFPRGVDAYMLLPAKEENLRDTMKSLDILREKHTMTS